MGRKRTKSTKLTDLRNRKFIEQRGRCIYCRQPMWTGSAAAFRETHRLTDRQARLFQCTAEHLKPASEGGCISAENIAAACLFCNTTRHRAKQPLSPTAFAARVQARLRGGRWRQMR